MNTYVLRVVSSLQTSQENFLGIFNLPMHATFLAHLTLLDMIILNIFGQEYKLWSSSLCNILQSPVTSSFLGPNILLSTLLSNIFNLYCFLCVRGQVSHP
jgi:hypothetical protein